MRVIMSIKSSDIDNAVKNLDSPTKDILMKYIYRGFEIPAEGSSAQLLTWHQKVFIATGRGGAGRGMYSFSLIDLRPF